MSEVYSLDEDENEDEDMMETSYKREIMNEDNFLKKAHKLKA